MGSAALVLVGAAADDDDGAFDVKGGAANALRWRPSRGGVLGAGNRLRAAACAATAFSKTKSRGRAGIDLLGHCCGLVLGLHVGGIGGVALIFASCLGAATSRT